MAGRHPTKGAADAHKKFSRRVPREGVRGRAIDVYTGNYHLIDVDDNASNLVLALLGGGPLRAHEGPYLDPAEVAPDITRDDIAARDWVD
jgi:hypothetical protein